jgi:Fe-S-cluster-containing hydrogenase component 2
MKSHLKKKKTIKKKDRIFLSSKKYIVFDPELCTGCQVCEGICSFVKEGIIRPAISRIQVQIDPFLGTIQNYMPMLCLQCDTPHCMLVCPVEGAMYVDEKTGARVIDETKCINCSKCMKACGSYFDPPRILSHPDKNIHVKCDLCGGVPECVKWCPNGALKYINRSEFMENGGKYMLGFVEAFEKDFGPTFEPFQGPKWRSRDARLKGD